MGANVNSDDWDWEGSKDDLVNDVRKDHENPIKMASMTSYTAAPDYCHNSEVIEIGTCETPSKSTTTTTTSVGSSDRCPGGDILFDEANKNKTKPVKTNVNGGFKTIKKYKISLPTSTIDEVPKKKNIIICKKPDLPSKQLIKRPPLQMYIKFINEYTDDDDLEPSPVKFQPQGHAIDEFRSGLARRDVVSVTGVRCNRCSEFFYGPNSESSLRTHIFQDHFVSSDKARQLEFFAETFKKTRIELGYSQAEVGLSLEKVFGGDFSQTTICRFEALKLSLDNMSKIEPMLRKWLEIAELSARGVDVSPANFSTNFSFRKKRKRRTSIEQHASDTLEYVFLRNQKLDPEEISLLANNLGMEKEVVRVWFYNRRQKERRLNAVGTTISQNETVASILEAQFASKTNVQTSPGTHFLDLEVPIATATPTTPKTLASSADSKASTSTSTTTTKASIEVPTAAIKEAKGNKENTSAKKLPDPDETTARTNQEKSENSVPPLGAFSNKRKRIVKVTIGNDDVESVELLKIKGVGYYF